MAGQRFCVQKAAVQTVTSFVVFAHWMQVEAFVAELARRERLTCCAWMKELARVTLATKREILAALLDDSFALGEPIRGYGYGTE